LKKKIVITVISVIFIFIYIYLIYFPKGEEKNTIRVPKNATIEEKGNFALKYMEEKYGEQFQIRAVTPKSWAYSFDEFFLYRDPKYNDKRYISVKGKFNKLNQYYFWDDFYGILIEEKYREKVEEIVDKEFEEYFYILNISSFGAKDLNEIVEINSIYDRVGDKFNVDMTFYVNSQSCTQAEFRNSITRIMNEFYSNKMVVYIYFTLINNYEINKEKEESDKNYITILEDEVLSIKKRIDVEKEELILLD